MSGACAVPQVAYSVVETTDPNATIKRTKELINEMRAVKIELGKEKPVDAFFLAIVDIVNLQSHLLLVGNVEQSLAVAAYDAAPLSAEVVELVSEADAHYLFNLGSRVSRKVSILPSCMASKARTPATFGVP
jgi:inorganic pyrophosphatase/exopolyphosphatase